MFGRKLNYTGKEVSSGHVPTKARRDYLTKDRAAPVKPATPVRKGKKR